MHFVLNRHYQRADIHKAVGGGNPRTYLPTQAGRVLAGFFHRHLNPDAPHIILPGTGPLIEGNAEVLRRQREPIPVFLKEDRGWRYVGLFRASTRKPTSEEIQEFQCRAGRNDVTTVVWMEEVAQ